MENINDQHLSNENLNKENLNHENVKSESLNHNENVSHFSPIKKAPVSDRKREANRRNAQKSTGPLSPIGKSYSRMNPLTHYVYATKVKLDLCQEDQEEFSDICRLI